SMCLSTRTSSVPPSSMLTATSILAFSPPFPTRRSSDLFRLFGIVLGSLLGLRRLWRCGHRVQPLPAWLHVETIVDLVVDVLIGPFGILISVRGSRFLRISGALLRRDLCLVRLLCGELGLPLLGLCVGLLVRFGLLDGLGAVFDLGALVRFGALGLGLDRYGPGLALARLGVDVPDRALDGGQLSGGVHAARAAG